MHRLAFILAVFFTFLVAVPCGDAQNNCGDQAKTEQKSQQTDNEDHSDSCSVFCFCACCGVHFSQEHVAFFQVRPETEAVSSKISTIYFLSLSGISYGIWQPPKIG